jgi:hypothetical protein
MVDETNNTNGDAVRFGAWRGRWLDQVHDDPDMRGDAFRVMYGISRFLNSKKREARPGDIALAERSHVSVRTAQRAIDKAAKAGHLCVTDAKGQSARILHPVLLDRRQPLRQEWRHEQRQEGRQEGRQPFRSSPAVTKTWAPDSHNSHNSQNYRDSRNPLQTPSGSASVAPRPRTTRDSDEAEIEGSIRDLVGMYGKMSIGGIVEYGRNKQLEGFDGVQVGRMIKKGLLVRYGDYVYLADDSELEF